jgi:Dolichyl-phosphate-mannose-protein mannosyltransferase
LQFSISNFQFPTLQANPHRADFLHAYPYWLFPALLALGLTLFYLNPFIGDWDAIDYTIYSLRGRPSSMALGRSLFTLTNHVLYVIAHVLFELRPEQAYLLFKYAVVIQTPLAVIVCWILARDLTGSVKSATISALLIACSPLLIIYGSQVMTDVPSVLLSAAAVLVYLRGVQTRSVRLMWLGAALLGLGVNLRETVGLYFPWIVVAPFVGGWKLDRRAVVVLGTAVVVFFFCALGIFAYWFISDAAYRESWQVWRTSAQSEAARHPLSVANLAPFLIYFFLVAPLVFLALPLAAWKEWRAREWSMLLAAAAVGLFANVVLLLNYSMVVNWRYFLTGLPMLAPLAGDYLLRSGIQRLGNERRAFAVSIAVIILVAGLMGVSMRSRSRDYLARLAQAKNYDERLRLIPDDAVVIAGAETIAVIYHREIGAGHWNTIGVGAGWPERGLEKAINDYLKLGRRVFLDTDSRCWQPCAWRTTEIAELVRIEPRFHFRRFAPNLYEIRARDDSSAADSPNLQSLLPQNRPEEVKKCFNSH